MKTNTTLMLCAVIIGFSACKKETSIDYSSALIGKWSWFITCPGLNTRICWTPDSTHKPYDIAFTSDFRYLVFHNGILDAYSKYSIRKAVSEDSKVTTYFIELDTGGQLMYFIKHDTLTIENSEGIIAYTSRYKKIE